MMIVLSFLLLVETYYMSLKLFSNALAGECLEVFGCLWMQIYPRHSAS